MAFTYIVSGENGATGSATTIAHTVTGLTSGDTHVVCAWVKHEGAAVNISASDGTAYTNVLTGGTAAAQGTNHGNGDLHAVFFYRSGVTGVTSVTVTATFASASVYRAIHIWVASYTDTFALDTNAAATGTGTAPNSGNITTAGTNWCVGGYGEYSAETPSARQINNTNADHSLQGAVGVTYTSSWDLIVASGFTEDAHCTISGGGADWICSVIAFKTTAAGGDPEGSLVGGKLIRGGLLMHGVLGR